MASEGYVGAHLVYILRMSDFVRYQHYLTIINLESEKAKRYSIREVMKRQILRQHLFQCKVTVH